MKLSRPDSSSRSLSRGTLRRSVALVLAVCASSALAQSPNTTAPAAAPADSAQVLADLKSRVFSKRLEALAKLAADATLPLPDSIRDVATDRDARIRAAALHVIAVRRPPQALEWMSQSLADFDLSVRMAAIAGLGQLGGDEARTKLVTLAGNRAELIRAAAVDALAEMQAFDAVRATIADKSWRVRRAVAKALAHDSGRQNIAAARQLITDPSGEVQRQVLDSLSAWPLEQAGPLLMVAIGEGAYLTRKDAAAQLAQRWPAAADFPVDAPPERRAELLSNLQSRWAAQFGQVDRATLAGATAPDRGAGSSPAVEDTESLDQMLGHFASEDLSVRRRASESLLARTKKAPLPPEAVARVYQLMVAEKDPTIWQNVLAAVADDPRQEATALAYAAISHPAADVRRRACEYLGAHGRTEFGPMLLPVLDDVQGSVVLAAATALGNCGPLADVRPLEQALLARDKRIRLAAATSLTRLGAPSGAPALERLAYDADETVRRDVAVNMGQLNDKMFVPTLIRLLDDKLGVKKAALKSLPQVTGQDAAADTIEVTEQVARWKKWYAANPF